MAVFIACLAQATTAHAQTSAPVIDTLVAPAAPVLSTTVSSLSVRAHDPAGLPLTYAWTATCGTLAPAGETATWTAPANATTCTVTARVTNSAGLTAAAPAAIQVIIQRYQGELPTFAAPQRIAAAPTGELYVVDGKRGEIVLLTRRGEVMGSLALPERPLAVAVSPAGLLVSTLEGNVLTVDPLTGGVLRSVAVGDTGPVGLAYEPGRDLIWMAERHRNAVRAIRPDGTTIYEWTRANTTTLVAPSAIAVDPVAGLVWIALQTNEGGPSLFAFTLQGAYVRSALPNGSNVGQVTRVGGIAVDAASRVYVTDIFQGHIQVVSSAGAALGRIGSHGTGPGQLTLPSDIAVMANGDLAVVTIDRGRTVRFGRDALPPACADDADCDGIPDAWEAANGLDATSATDALLDSDGDGLSSLREYRLGTNPRLDDTDGDGVPDGFEVEGGSNPLDPQDSPPAVAASDPPPSGPGLVRLSASVAGREGCVPSWTQREGPPVVLRDADTFAPSFVGRAQGDHVFEAGATCAGANALPATVTARVENAPPRAEPGRIRVVAPGVRALLDASFSADPNGDPLAFSWTQVAGPALEVAAEGARLSVMPPAPAVLSFQLTADDGRRADDAARVTVLAADPLARTPVAIVASPITARAGDVVTLDARASLAPAGAPSFSWTQVAGPRVDLVAVDGATPTFRPAEPGRYAFDATVTSAGFASPPARAEVLVSGAEPLPTAAVTTEQLLASVGEPVTLDGSASTAGTSSGALTYRWRQISGPAAGLTGADRDVATLVPFDPGILVLELTVEDGGIPGVPVRVRVEATAPGGSLPVAIATAPSTAPVNARVVLDGSASHHPAGEALNPQWTQVAGPWVALDESDPVRPAFTPRWPGEYAFELEVDDGRIRGAPARVAVAVEACGGDSDCDGLPDSWELQHGLDPTWPDATVDADQDALSALAEHAAGTDPALADTDGDGWSDGEEVAAGTNPRDPRDPQPVLAASDPDPSGPGLVQLAAALTGHPPCSVAWTQISGAPVLLRGAATFAPSFVARAAGEYGFQAVATCGRAVSDPVSVVARILNVPPRPDAGRTVVVPARAEVVLEGAFSTDANGDTPALHWEQVLGPATAAIPYGGTLAVSTRAEGTLAFRLTATDAAGASASEDVAVYVVKNGIAPTAIAASPRVAAVGTAVALDASASVVAANATASYQWVQLDGPAVTLAGAATAVARFTPPSPGVYRFAVTVSDGTVRSPSATVEVHAAAGGVLPRAAATASATSAAGAALSLDGTGSRAADGTTAVTYRWRQVAGPAAGLTGDDRAVATVVPFSAGAYVFELSVYDGGGESLPARVAFTASAPGAAVPIVTASAPATVPPRTAVTLTGAGSGAGGQPLRFRWTQVSGPWVVVEGAATPAATFTPEADGTYVFELEVDDGAVRSAPARVTIQVGASAPAAAPDAANGKKT